MSAATRSSGATSRSSDRGSSCRVTPSRRATHGRVGPVSTVEITTITNTMSKSRSASVTPSANGIVASTIGTAPRSPAQETKRDLAPRHRLDDRADPDRDRPRHEGQQQAAHDGDPDHRPGDPARGQQQPEHHEQPDLGQPGDALGERPGRRSGAAARSCRARARRRRSRRSRTRARVAAAPYARRVRQSDRERVETRRRQRGPTHQPGAAEADAEPDRDAGDQLEDDHQDRGRDAVVGHGPGRDQGDQDDRRGVVEPRLGLERADQPRRTAAARAAPRRPRPRRSAR